MDQVIISEVIDLQLFADELEQSLWNDLVQHWFPRCIDPAGGFYQSFDREWRLGTDTSRFIVYQSRLTWVAATLAEVCPARRDEFLGYMRHGVRFLVDKMYEPEFGAFQWWLGTDDPRFRQSRDQRVVYGIAFALYALSAAARVGDEEALEYAKKTFLWLEKHCHDTEFGGYVELTERDGTPVLAQPETGVKREMIGNATGRKTHNTQLHLMEAIGELYRVWPDELVRQRLAEMVGVLSGPFVQEGGQSASFLTRDLQVTTDQISYGHDIEAAHLLLDSAAKAGIPLPLKVAQEFADYTLDKGWDREHGGFYYAGTNQGEVTNRHKSWWVAAEALLGLVAVWKATKDERYLQYAEKMWRFIQEKHIDPKFGGWYSDLDEAGIVTNDKKAYAWKAFYHETRALLNSASLLRR